MRMNAYYFGFGETGEAMVDRILSAVACAGKAFHHTEAWSDKIEEPYEDVFRGECPVDWIQNAANDAAAETKRMRDVLQKIASLELSGGAAANAAQAALSK